MKCLLRCTLPWYLLLLCGVIWQATPVLADERNNWWMFHDDPQHTGLSGYSCPLSAQTQWAFSTDSDIESSPAIGADGTIYVGSDDKHLYAINPDGLVMWEYGTGANIESSPAIG